MKPIKIKFTFFPAKMLIISYTRISFFTKILWLLSATGFRLKNTGYNLLKYRLPITVPTSGDYLKHVMVKFT